MNLPLLLLIIIVIPLLIIFLVVGFRNLNQVSDNKNVYVLDVNQDYCYPNGILTNLQPAGNKCCAIMGQSTGVRPIFYTIGNFPIGVGANPVPVESVCFNFCQNIDQANNKCLDSPGTDYFRCVYYLTPSISNTQCTSLSIPIAYNGLDPYYGISNPVVTLDSNNNITSCNEEDLVDC